MNLSAPVLPVRDFVPLIDGRLGGFTGPMPFSISDAAMAAGMNAGPRYATPVVYGRINIPAKIHAKGAKVTKKGARKKKKIRKKYFQKMGKNNIIKGILD